MHASELDRHIAALEAQNRRLRQLVRLSGGILLLAALAVAGWKKGIDDVVQAKKFQVVNDQGKVVGVFGLNEKGGSKLTIDNHLDVKVLEAGETLDQASSILLYDRRGIPRFGVGPRAQSDDYLLMVAGKSGGQNQIQLGEFGAAGSGIQMFHAGANYPLLRMMVTGDQSTEIGMQQIGGGGLTLKSNPTEVNIAFTNMIREGTTSRLGASLFVNKPAGYLMQIDYPSGTVYWPRKPASQP